MFEKEIEEYERIRQEYQQKVADRMSKEQWMDISVLKQIRTEGTDERLRVGELCSGMHLITFFFKTAINRMKSELSQKRKDSLPMMFF